MARAGDRLRRLLLLGLVVRLAIAPWTGHYYDLSSFLNISYSVSRGFAPYLPHELGGYVKGAPPFFWDTPWSGYPPPWPTWLGITYFLGHWNPYVHILLVKVPMVLGDLLMIRLIFRVVGKRAGEELGFSAARAYSLLPPSIFIGSVWGMPDALGSLFLLLSLSAIERGPVRSALLNAVSISVKLLPIVQTPVVALEAFKRRRLPGGALYLAVTAVGILLLMILPFALVVEPSTLFQVIVPSLYKTYSERATEVAPGFSYPVALAMLSHGSIGLDPWIPSAIAIAFLYGVWLRRGSTGRGAEAYAMLSLIGLATILLLGRSNPQYFMIAYPYMVIFSYWGRRELIRRLFHASWASWLIAVCVQQNPLRFLNPLLPEYVGTVRDFHGNWFGRPDSPFGTERAFYWFIHSSYTSWIMPATLLAFLILSTLYAVVVLRSILGRR